MATALVSALTGIPTREDVAMTGEITLLGNVLPIGGLNEKVVAAMRAGVKEVILPKLNEKDLKDLPDFVRNGVKFRLVETMDEVLQIAMTAPIPVREEVPTVASVAEAPVPASAPSASAEGDDPVSLPH